MHPAHGLFLTRCSRARMALSDAKILRLSLGHGTADRRDDRAKLALLTKIGVLLMTDIIVG